MTRPSKNNTALYQMARMIDWDRREGYFAKRRRWRRMSRDVVPRNDTLPMLLIFAAALLLFWLTLVGWATCAIAQELPRAMWVNVHEDSALNVRAEPCADADIILCLGRGCEVEVREVKDGWALIGWPKYPERAPMGWVCADYLAAP